MTASTKPYDQRAPNARTIDQMSSDELREHIAAIRFAQMSMKAKNAQKGSTNTTPMQVRQNRRTMARMITILVKRGERVVG